MRFTERHFLWRAHRWLHGLGGARFRTANTKNTSTNATPSTTTTMIMLEGLPPPLAAPDDPAVAKVGAILGDEDGAMEVRSDGSVNDGESDALICVSHHKAAMYFYANRDMCGALNVHKTQACAARPTQKVMRLGAHLHKKHMKRCLYFKCFPVHSCA